jgi:hypothetical protein
MLCFNTCCVSCVPPTACGMALSGPTKFVHDSTFSHKLPGLVQHQPSTK